MAEPQAREGEETCPECRWGISWHNGWGGPGWCSLTDMGVAQRNWDARATTDDKETDR